MSMFAETLLVRPRSLLVAFIAPFKKGKCQRIRSVHVALE